MITAMRTARPTADVDRARDFYERVVGLIDGLEPWVWDSSASRLSSAKVQRIHSEERRSEESPTQSNVG